MAGQIGRPRKVISDEHIRQIEQLAAYDLTIPKIAAVLDISERTLARWKKSKHVAQAFARGKAKAEAVIGKSLFELARDGNVNAIRWWEITRAGRRETVRTETSGIDGLPIQVDQTAKVTFYLPDNGRNPLPVQKRDA
jgi:hypothetical protein